ncbi:6-bladed beta-propeller [candidate division KSB1 bacterium]|nr:6-bladed beta-propeller [candidate division KSB1 bacterium]
MRVYGGGVDELDENLQFYKPRDAVVDADGNLYVLDAGNFRVQKFDKTGEFVRSFGGQGQGPGEFEDGNSIDINSNGNLTIVEMMQGLELDKNGEEIRRIKKDGRRLDSYTTMKSGNIAIVMYADMDEEPLLGIFDKDLNFIRGIGMKEDHGTGENDWLYNFVQFTPDNESNIYFSYYAQNRIDKYSLDGSLIWRSDRPLGFEPQMVEVWGRQSPSNVSLGIGIDHKKRLWVTTFNRIITENDWDNFYTEPEIASFHLFDNDGVFLGVVPILNITFFGGTSALKIYGDRLFIVDSENMSVTEYKIIEK